ncbi:branched-chain amino acid ABC transporter ATP-binding protein LivF (plasmid) [Ketogulonicigenium robustum]|uniref:Branched-chain amino acid ABC transporter ATP-binding protein LivF n=1 Tax=Ketogulonicigenium robustum TaxID=92947 RepID=A0A1W6P3D3_9RHOB|nr:ABC transporter ATP-binding protein [Ketogulonicigenium robustum]ARO16012.1 branched-chain amino acid ABC transporter ATP-binding protein LivF [Ketogulonicigenium robustum]
MLEANAIVAGYGAAEQILKGASLNVQAGELVTIIGPNGAGKSTLLKTIAGLVPAKEGKITLAGQDVTAQSALERAKSGFAFVMQERNVFGMLQVKDNLELAYSGPRRGFASARDAMMDRYPVLAQRRHQLARTFSGGQRQILAMAMALLTKPKILLLDEPTAGLSPKATNELFDAIIALRNEGMPILMVEQHALEALQISSRGYVLVAGKDAATGTGAELAADPEIRRLFLGG